MTTFKVEITVQEYTGKYYPLREHVGDGNIGETPLTFDVCLPDFSPFIVVGDKPYLVSVQGLVQAVAEKVLGTQNSSEESEERKEINRLRGALEKINDLAVLRNTYEQFNAKDWYNVQDIIDDVFQESIDYKEGKWDEI